MNEELKTYLQKKNTLAQLLSRAAETIERLEIDQVARKLRQLSDKVSNDTFKIQIVGTFNNGKSTFINSLLGEAILPARVLPCTAVVNEIKYGNERRAVLHFRNPLPQRILDTVPDVTLQHMRQYDMTDVPPMDIDYNNMDQYVVIPVNGNPDEISAMSPYLAVELYYPSPLLQEGVELIDSPGLNECDERTRCTLEYLDKADAIIYLLDAERACAQDEMNTIEQILLPKGFNDMFFVANRFDRIPQVQKAGVRQFIERRVGGFTPNAIYCVSALEFLEGKVYHDENRIAASGMTQFEQRLTEFLTRDKGRIKLLQPARELNRILTSEVIGGTIPRQRQMLQTNLRTLQMRYDAALPQIQQLENQKNLMCQQMILSISRSRDTIRRTIDNHFTHISASIPAWIQNYTPVNSIGFASKPRVQRVVDEIVNHVSEQIKNDLTTWNAQVLIPLVEQEANNIYESTDTALTGLFNSIDLIGSQLSGNNINVIAASGWERVAGLAALFLGGSASGAYMLVGGFNAKGIAKSIALDLGVGTGLTLLSLTNPVIAIGAAVVVIWNAIVGGAHNVLQRIRNEVSTTLTNSIMESKNEKANELADRTKEEFTKIADLAVGSLDIKLNALKAEAQTIKSNLDQGQQYANERTQIINECEQELTTISSELTNLVIELAEPPAANE